MTHQMVMEAFEREFDPYHIATCDVSIEPRTGESVTIAVNEDWVSDSQHYKYEKFDYVLRLRDFVYTLGVAGVVDKWIRPPVK